MKTLLVDITSKCNLRCKHCYNSRYFYENNDMFDVNYFKKVLHQISNTGRIERIHLLGGEPLLSSKLFEILDISSVYSKYISINTNGLLLDKNIISKLSKYNKIDQVTISLDGATEITNDNIRGKGVYQQVINNLRENKDILKSLFQVNIACVLTEQNFLSIREFSTFDSIYKIDKFLFSFIYKQGNGKNITSFINAFDLMQEIARWANQIGEDRVLLDVPPLFVDWLNVFLENDNKIDVISLPKCGEDTLYYSALNKIYMCSPSSFYGSKYEITSFQNINYYKRRCLQNCNHISECTLCPINLSHEGFEMCHQIINKIDNIYPIIENKKIKESNHYVLSKQNGNLLYINFMNHSKITLIKKFNGNISLEICNLAKSITSKKELLEFKSKICAMFYWGKIEMDGR